jgi:putative ABC transport system permease protein
VHGAAAVVVPKVLLTFQAALFIGLISAIFIFNGQLQALQKVQTGFATDSRLIISGLPKDSVYTQNPSRVISRLNRLDDVAITMPLDTHLTDSFLYSFELTFPNGSTSDNTIPAVGTGLQAAKNLGLTFLAGRDFEVEHTSDWFVSSESKSQASILITESLARLSGFKTAEDAVGQTFLRGGLNLRIVGVVEDVLLGNIRESYSQVLFICGFTLTPNMNVLLTHQPDISLLQQTALINNIKEVLAEELNVFEPNISLVSDNANANLDADKRLLNIISMFGALVIIIACVGVFGLASFATH